MLVPSVQMKVNFPLLTCTWGIIPLVLISLPTLVSVDFLKDQFSLI